MPDDTITVAKVELYNRCERGRAVGNGWMVGGYTADGRRGPTLADFQHDEDAARAFQRSWTPPPWTLFVAPQVTVCIDVVRGRTIAINMIRHDQESVEQFAAKVYADIIRAAGEV